MRISLLTDGIYPYVIGGMQKHSFYLAKYLAQAGHSLDLYHYNASGKNADELELFTPEERKNITSILLEFPSMAGYGHYLRESYEFSKRIYEVYKDRAEPDFIYAKGFAGWELLNRKTKGVKFPPMGVNFHGYEMFQAAPSFKSWLEQRLLFRGPARFCMNNADVVFSYGGKITELLLSLGIGENRIVQIPAGIDESWLNERNRNTGPMVKFVFIGRWERRKGVEELNYCLQKMTSAGISYEMHFIGPVPEKHKIVSPSVIYHGEIREQARIMDALLKCDVLVCPSHSEGMPNVILEGMASSLAIIATDTGAVRLMVDASNGSCIEPGNKKQLYEAMTEAVREKGSTIAKGKRSYEKVKEQFLWNEVARKTIEAIEMVLTRTELHG